MRFKEGDLVYTRSYDEVMNNFRKKSLLKNRYKESDSDIIKYCDWTSKVKTIEPSDRDDFGGEEVYVLHDCPYIWFEDSVVSDQGYRKFKILEKMYDER